MCSFACDKDVAGDDVLGVISTLKGLLEDIKCQVSKESRTRSGRIMRQPSLILHKLKLNDVECDQLATAKSYRKTHLLGKCFSGWVKVVAMAKDGQVMLHCSLMVALHYNLLLLGVSRW